MIVPLSIFSIVITGSLVLVSLAPLLLLALLIRDAMRGELW